MFNLLECTNNVGTTFACECETGYDDQKNGTDILAPDCQGKNLNSICTDLSLV